MPPNTIPEASDEAGENAIGASATVRAEPALWGTAAGAGPPPRSPNMMREASGFSGSGFARIGAGREGRSRGASAGPKAGGAKETGASLRGAGRAGAGLERGGRDGGGGGAGAYLRLASLSESQSLSPAFQTRMSGDPLRSISARVNGPVGSP